MCRQLDQLKKERVRKERETTALSSTQGTANHGSGGKIHRTAPGEGFECVALHVSPDLGERIMLSGERALLDEVCTVLTAFLNPVRVFLLAFSLKKL